MHSCMIPSTSVRGVENGYVVRVTPKIVFYVTKPDIFKSQPHVRRIGNDDGVVPNASVLFGWYGICSKLAHMGEYDGRIPLQGLM